MTNPITRINGIDIVTVDRDGEIFVPIKPICQAIGVDYAAQYNKLQIEEMLSSTIAIIAMVAADGKERDMVAAHCYTSRTWLSCHVCDYSFIDS